MTGSMPRGVDMRRLARDEQADFAAFLATLPLPQWQAVTLCARWRVRDVAAHVISYDELGLRELLGCVARELSGPGQRKLASRTGPG